ncbi:hypothetical protein [Roseimaritima sediminicola]|uniref:hypothetical protein n=1 Tax=Roseimaritima sediminicola TaxID=2662066 RepID=UPI0012983C2A|nr:hypothetical protein [Roseimaritima sediminicola]
MLQLTAVSTTPPGTGGLCRVRIPVREASTAAVGARIEAQLVDQNQAIGNAYRARSVTRAKTNATGYADLLLPQGLTYQVRGTHGNHEFLNVQYTVPATAEAYLATGLQEWASRKIERFAPQNQKSFPAPVFS